MTVVSSDKDLLVGYYPFLFRFVDGNKLPFRVVRVKTMGKELFALAQRNYPWVATTCYDQSGERAWMLGHTPYCPNPEWRWWYRFTSKRTMPKAFSLPNGPVPGQRYYVLPRLDHPGESVKGFVMRIPPSDAGQIRYIAVRETLKDEGEGFSRRNPREITIYELPEHCATVFEAFDETVKDLWEFCPTK